MIAQMDLLESTVKMTHVSILGAVDTACATSQKMGMQHVHATGIILGHIVNTHLAMMASLNAVGMVCACGITSKRLNFVIVHPVTLDHIASLILASMRHVIPTVFVIFLNFTAAFTPLVPQTPPLPCAGVQQVGPVLVVSFLVAQDVLTAKAIHVFMSTMMRIASVLWLKFTTIVLDCVKMF